MTDRDLSKLTHAEKIKLLSELDGAQDEKERRKRERAIEYYEPMPKQALFHDNDNKLYSFFIGGNQTGKTTCGLCDDIADALGYEPWSGRKRKKDPPLTIVIVGEDYPNAISKVIIPKLMEYLPQNMILKINKIQGKYIESIILKNGSILQFMTYEQESKKFEGWTADVVHWDEPPPHEHFVAALRGIMRLNGRMKFTFTAIKEPWIRDDLIENAETKDIFVTNATLDENKHLPEEMKQAFIAQLDPDEITARVEGGWLDQGGSIYKSFNREIHMIPEADFDPTKYPCGMVIDPHDRKPFMMAWFAVLPENEIVFFAEWPYWDKFHKIKSHENTVADYIKLVYETEDALGISENMNWRYIDPNSGNKRNAVLTEGESFVDLFAMEGLFFDYEIKDNIAYGHKIVKDYLNQKKLFFTDNLINLPGSMELYRWAEFKRSSMGIKEVPEEKYKDPCDCVRYVCVKDPEFIDFQAPVRSYYSDSRRKNYGLGG